MKQPANRFAASLTDEQVKRFMLERRQKQQDDRDEFRVKNGTNVYQSFQRKLEKNMDSWLGDVEPAQRPLIAESAHWQQQYYGTWLDYQDVWLEALDRTLAVRGSPAFEPGMVSVVLKGDELGNGRFERYIADSRQRSIKWFAALSASLSDEQRQTIRNKLSDLASELESLTHS
jgi:hypothetical protein